MTSGGNRAGAGRPKQDKPPEEMLKMRSYRTTDKEHEIIKRWLIQRHRKEKEPQKTEPKNENKAKVINRITVKLRELK